MSLTELLRNWLVSEVLTAIGNLRGEIMATAQEFRDSIAALRAAHTNLIADIQRILANQDGGGMTAAEENELLGELRTAVTEAEAAAAIVPDPEPGT